MLSNKILSKIALAIGGAIYLGIFSNIEINILFKSYVTIIPIQIAALIYGIYLINWGGKSDSKTKISSIKNCDRG